MAVNLFERGIFKVSPEDGQYMKYEGWRNVPTSLITNVQKMRGTVTLQTSTVTYDVDYVDIPIVEGELGAGDVVYLQLNCHNTSNQTIKYRLDIDGVTAPQVSEEGNVGTAKYMFAELHSGTSPVESFTIYFMLSHTDNAPSHSDTIRTGNTSDTDYIKKPHTYRLNCKFGGVADVECKVGYIIYKIVEPS